MQPNHGEPPHASTASIVSLILCILSWQLTAVLLVVEWLFGPAWLGPEKKWAAIGASVLLSGYYSIHGRNRLAIDIVEVDGKRAGLTLKQAALVVILMILAGAFGTWLLF